MKFDVCIGNPPYQDDTLGDNDTYAPPVYDKMLDAAFSIADVVEMIHPARFLFNAGSTSKEWNKKTLNNSHIKVLRYEPDCKKVFPNISIPGGVAVTYFDRNTELGPIGDYTPFKELNSIKNKVVIANTDYLSLT